MDRKELVKKLLNDDARAIQEGDSGIEWIIRILETGFIGYQNMSFAALKQEAQERGLI